MGGDWLLAHSGACLVVADVLPKGLDGRDRRTMMNSLTNPSSSSSSIVLDNRFRATTRTRGNKWIWISLAAFLTILLIGTVRNPNFWSTPDQRGETLMRTR